MTTSDALAWVRLHMPVEAEAARRKFVEVNPRQTGIHWDDALDMLLDADAHLEIIEPVIDLLPEADAMLVAAITMTVLYSDRGFATEYDDRMRAEAVAATIRNHE
jgi:hypothetical protein